MECLLLCGKKHCFDENLFIFSQIKAMDLKLVWKLAGILLAHYQVGDEFYIRKILREIIFNPDDLDPTDSVIWKLRNTELNQGKIFEYSLLGKGTL